MNWTHTWGEPGEYSFARNHHMVAFGDRADPGCFGFLVFQDGSPVERGINGTTNEEVLSAIMERIQALNQPPYQSGYNDRAISDIQSAILELDARTKSRQVRNVEGTSTP